MYCRGLLVHPETDTAKAKAMTAFLSGEMKDTVQLHPAGSYGT